MNAQKNLTANSTLVSSIHKLTNSDISKQYQDKTFWCMIGEFKGAFAHWAVQQFDGNSYGIVADAITAYEIYLQAKIFSNKDVPVELHYKQIEEITSSDIFEDIPEIMLLNQTKNGFIDLGALSRNVFYQILRNQITQPL